MNFITCFINFIKRNFGHICFVIAALLGFSAIFFNPSESANVQTDKGRVKFIEKYGWRVEQTAYLCEKVQIPVTFDGALKEYAEMQKNSGFDLSKYRGAVTERYSYRVLNHARDQKYAYANVFVYQGKIIAADIVSPKTDGFIAPINDVENIKKE